MLEIEIASGNALLMASERFSQERKIRYLQVRYFAPRYLIFEPSKIEDFGGFRRFDQSQG
tara:strand:+ start:276 stop:455 length:180 start_codon:yes stop_codon:yes gene_type:complete